MDQEKIGAFIAAMRKEKGLTQEQLADRLRVNSRTVSRWETGRNMPDYAVLEPLTEELGITVNELIRGERIIKEDIVRAYDGNLVAVLKEYRRLKRAKNIILCIMLVLAGLTLWLGIVLGLPYALAQTAQPAVNTEIALYNEYIGADAQRGYRNKCDMDESIFPAQITDKMHVTDYKMVRYDPWDPQWLSYLVADYDDEAWAAECARLSAYPSSEYIGCYGVTGFERYKPLAVCAGTSGFVYALADQESQRIIYVELIFHNFFFDLDYTFYIPAGYLPEGFDATPDNPYRAAYLEAL